MHLIEIQQKLNLPKDAVEDAAKIKAKCFLKEHMSPTAAHARDLNLNHPLLRND